MDRSLLPAFLVLFASFLLFEGTGIDLAVQDRFYDFGSHRWIVDPGAPLPRFLFYTSPKVVLVLLGLGAAALALGPGRWRTRLRLPEGCRRDLA